MLGSPNSGVMVFPMITNPAARIRATVSSSKSGTRSCQAAVAKVVRMPAVLLRSLIEIGTPRKGGAASPPAASSLSASRARPREVVGHRDVRADLRIDAVDAFQVELDELGGGHLAAAHEFGLLECGRERDVLVHRSPPVPLVPASVAASVNRG